MRDSAALSGASLKESRSDVSIVAAVSRSESGADGVLLPQRHKLAVLISLP